MAGTLNILPAARTFARVKNKEKGDKRMEKRTGETLYVCEKCGAYYLNEECCRAHEKDCDGERQGNIAAQELTDKLQEIRYERGIELVAQDGGRVCEAVYDKELKHIVITSF